MMIVPISQGNSFDDLNIAYVSSVSQLPRLQENKLIPDVIWRQQGHIIAWIDIIGFKNQIKENGTYYIRGNPEDGAVVRYGFTHDIKENFDSIDGSISYSQSGNNLIASLTVVLKWHVWCRSKTSSWICGRPTETKTFQDIEIIPAIYPNISISEIKVHTSKNSTKAIIEVDTDNFATGYTLITANGSVSRLDKIFQVSFTAKGIPYGNESSIIPIWKIAGNGISHQGNDIISDSDNISFNAITPFDINNSSNITKVIEPGSSMSMLNVFIGILFVFGYTACKLSSRMIK